MLRWLPRAARTGGRNGRPRGNGTNGHGLAPGSNGHGKVALQAAAGQATLRNGAIIDLQAITKAYETAAGPFWALRGIDLQVYAGEFVAVVGKSGSGKSTLINMFTGIDHPTDGEVLVAGTRIRQLDEGRMAEWRGHTLGIVFQFFQLLPTLTLVENVMLPMDLAGMYDPGERHDRALYLLEQVGVAEDASSFPSAVSGGHQQRAAIARALANDPPIVVADEPTGNLDSSSAETVFGLFQELVAGGKTILMVTHDEELAGRVPRTITLADGLIVDEEVRILPFVGELPAGPAPTMTGGIYLPQTPLPRNGHPARGRQQAS